MQILRSWLSLTAVLTSAACADIRQRPPVYADRPLRTELIEVPVDGAVAQIAQRGTTLSVDVSRVCDVRRSEIVDRTITTDDYNATPGGTWALLGTGAAAAATGVGLLYDARNTYPDDETSRLYNKTGPEKERVWGYALVGTGALFGAGVVVDIIRAQGSTAERTIASVPDGVERNRVQCRDQKIPNLQVMGVLVNDRFELGHTSAVGHLDVDLDQTVREETALTPLSRLNLYGGGSLLGNADLNSLYLKREAQAFLRAEAPACVTPVDANSCDGVERFLLAYPDGPHSLEARSARDGSRARILALADEGSWSRIDLKACMAAEWEHPDQVRNACRPIRQYSDDFPNGKHVEEARRALEVGETRARLLVEKLEKAKRAEIAKKAAEERATQAKEAAAERRQCIAQCRMNCSTWSTRDQVSCYTGCVESRCGEVLQ